MSRIIDGVEHFDRNDFSLMAGCQSPVAVNHVRDQQTLGAAHYHDFYELATVLDGSGRYEYQGVVYDLNPGDTFIIQPGTRHHYLEQRKLSLINFIWYPEELPVSPETLNQIPGYREFFDLEPQSRSIFRFEYHLVLMPEQTAAMQLFYRRIENELKERANGYFLTSGLIFTELLITVSRFYNDSKKHFDKNGNDLQKIGEVLAFIDANYMHRISRSKAAKIYGSSETTFSRSFKRIMTESFFDYLLNLRLRHAREMLCQSDASISRIAQECGFCDSNYLCYRFRMKFGIPPHQYRISGQKNDF